MHYRGGREGSWRIYFNDNVNPNDNELSTECVLQVIESPSGENQQSLANKEKSKSDKNNTNAIGGQAKPR